jgi:Terminase small subunit
MKTESKVKKEIVKRPPKTLKERRFVKEYLKTGNATEAVRQAGYNVTSVSSATTVANINMTKLDMSSWFEKAGLTNEVIAQNTTRIALTAKKRDQFSGEMYDDNKMQLDGMRFASELMGLSKKEDSSPVFNYFQFIQSQKNNFNGS